MKIFELTLTKLRYREFLEEIQEYTLRPVSWDRSHGRTIFTPNPEICLKTLEDLEFLEVLRQADYLTSDGIGLYLAYQINDYLQPALSPGRRELERGVVWSWEAKRAILWKKMYLESRALWRKIFLFFLLPYYISNLLFRKKYLYRLYGDRICGSDLTSELLTFAQKNALKIAIVDPYFPDDEAKCEAQKYFRMRLSQLFPKLDFELYILRNDNQREILEALKHSEAKICFATLGMKKQELFCLEVQKNCPSVALALWVGSSFDYYTWFQKRAPKLWRESWFEWLYRIFTSPNKLKRLGRIYQALMVFPIRVILYKK